MEFYCKENFGPENFILLGSLDDQKKYAENIVSEISAGFPQLFEGTKKFFCFELRYVPPFDKNFGELKRLQGIAAEAAGRRNEFKGYIIINLSNYLTHEKEDYLRITLQFLIDMSHYWKYIFLVDDSNYKAARELVRNTLNILLHDIPCKVKEQEKGCTAENIVNRICLKQNIICSPAVKNLLEELIKKGRYNPDLIAALLMDVSGNCRCGINMEILLDSLKKSKSAVKYMLTQKEFEQLISDTESQGGRQ